MLSTQAVLDTSLMHRQLVQAAEERVEERPGDSTTTALAVRVNAQLGQLIDQVSNEGHCF